MIIKSVLRLTLLAFCFLPLICSAQDWTVVGSGSISSSFALYPKFAEDKTASPAVLYTAYYDFGVGGKGTVQKYDGTNWVTVGSAGFTASPANDPDFVIAGNGTPYFVYRNQSSSNRSFVMSYDGSSWSNVGGAAASPEGAYINRIDVDSANDIYTMFRENSNDNNINSRLTVMKYDGTNWNVIGTRGFTQELDINVPPVFKVHGTTPYVAYQEGGQKGVTVKKFDGLNWVNVGSAHFGTIPVASGPDITQNQGAHDLDLNIDAAGNIHVAFFDRFNGDVESGISVMKYNGSSWEVVGTQRHSSATNHSGSRYPSIDFNGNELILGYKDVNNGNKISVVKLNGANWTHLGLPGFTSGIPQDRSISIIVGSLFVGYSDQSNSHKATAMSYSGSGLPIELISFEAKVVEKDKVALSWATASEEDNAFFTIEKSIDGRAWQTLKTIATKGYSIEITKYQDRDEKPFDGISYYRLRQNDFNGNYTFSKIESVQIKGAENIITSIFPVPAEDEVTITIDQYKYETDYNISLIDIAGQRQDAPIEFEDSVIRIKVNDLVPGVYFLVVQKGSIVETAKIVVEPGR